MLDLLQDLDAKPLSQPVDQVWCLNQDKHLPYRRCQSFGELGSDHLLIDLQSYSLAAPNLLTG